MLSPLWVDALSSKSGNRLDDFLGTMQEQLAAHPLAELIREIMTTDLSGALRLERERAKAAVYFERGALVFAASNLRAHRLRESFKRAGVAAELPADLSGSSDDVLARGWIERGLVTKKALTQIRSQQVVDILRTTLLWTNGTWEFDPRVRLADDVRVRVDVCRLLLECARHLPNDFVGSRFRDTSGVTYLNVANGETNSLLPTEVLVLSRATTAVGLSELTAMKNVNEPDELRAIYALSLSGLLRRKEWPSIGLSKLKVQAAPAKLKGSFATDADFGGDAATVDVEAFLARLANARDHYEVLDVAKFAEPNEVKRAYHRLARHYHPDRFHQSDPELRARIDSAFARIAQAYEVLSDDSQRAGYDAKVNPNAAASATAKAKSANDNGKEASEEAKTIPSGPEEAESIFRQALTAMQSNQNELAIRLFARAAMLGPRVARYRAQYGYALIGTTNARRVAESELQVAISLEPNNVSHRVMLAKLYERLGLLRRARGELERGMTIDPKNDEAKKLLASIKKKC